MARFGMLLEPQMLQICELCQQEILAERQLPMNAIVIEGHGMCPSCRQRVSARMQCDKRYLRKWQRFINSTKLDL